jgi:hypothetical protein
VCTLFGSCQIKDAKVSEYGGRSLNVSFNSSIMINPDIEESRQLARWYTIQQVYSLFLALIAHVQCVLCRWFRSTSAGAHNIESLSNQRGGGSSSSAAAGGSAMFGDRKTMAQITSENLGMRDKVNSKSIQCRFNAYALHVL